MAISDTSELTSSFQNVGNDSQDLLREDEPSQSEKRFK